MSEAQLAVVDTQKIESRLATLAWRAEAIEVRDQDSYTEACQIALDCRAEIRAIGHVLDPGIDSARRHLEMLRQQKQGYVSRVQPWADMAATKAARWKGEQERQRKAEEDRLNEEARVAAAKAAEEQRLERERQADIDRRAHEREIEQLRKAGEINKREAERYKREAAAEAEREKARAAEDAARRAANPEQVKVASSVPTVAGIRRRVNYNFTVTDPSAVRREYLTPDLAAIGRRVRSDKDPEKSEREIGGIRVTAEDAI
jgi:hypothetical protein